MNAERAISLLRDRLAETADAARDEAFDGWRTRTELTLRSIYGDDHILVEKFLALSFVTHFGDAHEDAAARRQGVGRAAQLLESAIFEREQLSVVEKDSDAVDHELWEHVGHLVDGEHWSQLPGTTATFLESKVREWAGLSPDDYGKSLMIKAFKPDGGRFPCGNTDGEEQGWQQLATGFVQAIGNVDRHRVQQRDDAKAYAMGVVGAASLILTQLRYQHASRFRS